MASKRILVDTSAFYALISSTDRFHAQARPAYERLVDWEWELWTTSYVLLETSALLHHRLGFQPLQTFMGIVYSDIFNVLWIEDALHREAWKRMAERNGEKLSIVDWTTVVAAGQLNASVFTFDRGFHSEGVLTFPK